MHLSVAHPRLEARGRSFPRSPRSRSRINAHVLRPLTRGPQGQPSPLRTPNSRPRVQGFLPTSRGQAPHGLPMVHHSMETGFSIPWGFCSVFSAFPHPLVRKPATSLSPVPRAVTRLGLFRASCAFPFSLGCRAAIAPQPSLFRPLLPSSRVYTPPDRKQPCGAGPVDGHPSRDRFVRPARVAPLPPPSLSPVPRPVTLPGLFPASRAFPFSWGCCAALATRPSLSRPLFPSSHVYTPPGRQQPFGAGPLDPHPSGDPFLCLALVALPFGWCVSFRTCWGPFFLAPPLLQPVPRPFPHPVTCFLFVCSFRASPAVPLLPVCSFPFPAACSLCALRRPLVLCGLDFFFSVCPTPFPLGILPCGTVLPACTHVSTALVIRSRLPSVLFSCPIALTPHTMVEDTPPRDTLPPLPRRATLARKGARCGAGAGSPRPHRPHPGHTGRGTLAARSRGRAAGGGTAPDTRRPSQRWQASPPGKGPPPPPRHAAPTGHAGQGDSVGPPHPHTHAHSTWVVDPDSPPSGRAVGRGTAPDLRRP